MPLPKNNSIAIDIDDTLLINGRISQPILEWCKARQNTHRLTLWSSRGERYAREIATRFDLLAIFHHICGKPHHVVDDNWPSLLRDTKFIHPKSIRCDAKNHLPS